MTKKSKGPHKRLSNEVQDPTNPPSVKCARCTKLPDLCTVTDPQARALWLSVRLRGKKKPSMVVLSSVEVGAFLQFYSRRLGLVVRAYSSQTPLSAVLRETENPRERRLTVAQRSSRPRLKTSTQT